MSHKRTYYNPKPLIIGILVFAISCIFLGYFYGVEQNNVYLWVLPFIGLFIGEGLILQSASYATQNNGKVKA